MAAQTGRKDWIDVLRGLAFLFVFVGHFWTTENAYFVFTSPVKVSLFFIISGYLFNDMDGRTGAFLKKIILRFIIPWLLLCLAFPFVRELILAGDTDRFLRTVLATFAGKRVWYMPACIIAETVYFLICKYSGDRLHRGLLALLAVCTGWTLHKFGLMRFAMFDTALIAQGFLFFGTLVRDAMDGGEQLKPSFAALLTCAYVALGFLSLKLYPDACIDVHLNRYYDPFISIPMIVLGTTILFGVVPKLPVVRPLAFMGRYSIFYYILHKEFAALVRSFLEARGFVFADPLSFHEMALLVAISCIVMAPCVLIVDKLLPELIGKKRPAAASPEAS